MPAQATSATAAQDVAKVAGWYQMTRRNESALRLFSLLSQFHVAAQPDGTLTVSPLLSDDAGKPLRWHAVAPLHYREAGGRDRLDFVADGDGSIRYFTTDYLPAITVFQRVPGSRAMGAVGPLLALSMLAMVVALVAWIAGPWLRRHYHAALALAPGTRRLRRLSRLGVLALFAVVVGWFVLAAAIGANEKLLLQGSAAPWLVLLHALGVLALLGVVGILAHALRSVGRAERSRRMRAGEILLASAALYLGWFILAFGLVSFNTHF
jgi:hypothetical protein